MRIRYSIGLLLAAVTLAIFWQIRNHEFVWRDRALILEDLKGRAPAGANAFSPVADLSRRLANPIWSAVAGLPENTGGDARQSIDPRPFHTANILLHIFSALVVFAILRSLVPDEWAAGAGALFFALHPLQIEPVALASEMSHLLGGLLALIALWQYLLYASSRSADHAPRASVYSSGRQKRRRRFHYVAASFGFVLALLLKPLAAGVLLIAWILDYAFFRRSVRESANSLAPWLALILVFAAVALWNQPAARSTAMFSVWQRPFIAGDALAFYLYKLLVPLRLSVDYGRSPAAVVQQGWIYFTWLIPVALAMFLWLWHRRVPYLITAFAVFAAGVLPVLGFVSFGFQNISTVADRYVYLALLGPALALACVLSRSNTTPVFVACGILLAALGLKSNLQGRFWQNNVTLFTHALEVNSQSWISHYNLGLALAQKGTVDDAEQHYRAALKIKPNEGRAQYALGNLLASKGNFEEAIQHYFKSFTTGATNADAHYYLGNVFAKLNRLSEAVEQYDKSIQMNPQNAAAHASLGHILFRQRKLEEAMAQYRAALGIEPEAADVHYGLANALATRGELDEAVNHYRTALRINPSYAGAYYNLGTILARRGRLEDAISCFRSALQIRPDFADAHESLGRALVLQGKREEGMQHIEQALRILKLGRGFEPPQ